MKFAPLLLAALFSQDPPPAKPAAGSTPEEAVSGRPADQRTRQEMERANWAGTTRAQTVYRQLRRAGSSD